MILETQIAALVASTLVLGAFLLTHRRYPSEFSWFWVAGWSIYTLRFLLDLVITVRGPSYPLVVAGNEVVATSAILLLVAVDRLPETDRTDGRYFIGIWGLLSAWIVVGPVLTDSFALLHAPLYVAFGMIQLVTAYLFYQYLGGRGFSSTPLVVGSLAIWGLHKFDYPVLRPIEWLAPYGYMLGAVLAFLTGLGVMLFLVEDAEREARTERAIAERRSQEYEDLFDRLTDPVYIHDFDGNFRKVNDTAVDLLGYSKESLLEMTPRDIVAEGYAEDVDERIDVASTEDSVTFRSAHRTADGQVIPVAVHAGRITYRGEEAVLAVARDISDLRDRERELERYRQAVEGSTDALAAIDTEGRYFFVNPEYRALFGIDTETTLSGRPYDDVIDDTAVAEIEPNLERALDGETVTFEMSREDEQGSDRVFDTHYFPLESADGSIQGVGASIREITAERSRIRAIRQLSEYRRVLSAVNHLLVRADSARELLPSVVETLAESDLFGCSFLVLVEDAGPDFVCTSESGLTEASVREFHTQQYLDDVFESGTVRIDDVTEEPYRQHVDEQPSHPGVGIAVTYEGERLGVLTVHFPPDGNLEEAEFGLLEQLADDLGLFLHSQSLEQDLQTFTEIAERIDDPIMLQDLEGNFEVVNEALGRYADIEPGALIGDDEFAFMDEAAAERIREMKATVLADERPIRYEVTPTLPERGERIFSTIRYPHYDEDGTLDGTVAICRDVTDLKERERQLEVMDRVLRHNVNNNMTVVEGYAETIAETVEDPVAAEYAEKILDSGEALVSTVQKERRISKLLSDPPPTATFDIVPVIEAAIEVVERSHPDVTIATDLPTACRVRATESMGQAIEELVRNAVRHCDKDDPSVAVEIEARGDRVIVSVADNGPGIPEMEQRVLTGEADIEPLYHGSGLGLWLVNLVVQQSEGQLGFDENQPRGSVVTIELPAASEPRQQRPGTE